MKIYIKNMVCNRCKMVVQAELEKLNLHPTQVDLGEVVIAEEDISAIKAELVNHLQALGFDLIDDKRSKTIERIKNLIIDLVQEQHNKIKLNLSAYLAQATQLDYPYLSALFSEVEGTTIEQYYIAQKIEKVKELLIYDELSLKEIAFALNYSSVAHLSNQFKKVTGFSPSHFKTIKENKRKQIDLL